MSDLLLPIALLTPLAGGQVAAAGGLPALDRRLTVNQLVWLLVLAPLSSLGLILRCAAAPDGGEALALAAHGVGVPLRQAICGDLAAQGQRVLGVAFRPLDVQPGPADETALEREMTFIGMVGMIDPPRPEVREAVATAKAAGIRPAMTTGDHPLTAQQIARELDIATNGLPLTGRDLARMTVDDLESVVNDIAVYARVSPEHKLKIVQALQNQGRIVSMTGGHQVNVLVFGPGDSTWYS